MDAHFVTFYEDDSLLLRQVSHFIEAGLRAGEFCVVIATAPHRAAIEDHLVEQGLYHHPQDTQRVWYRALDAQDTMAKYMVRGMPDERRFMQVIEPVLRGASRNGTRRVRAFGEMVALALEDGKREAAIRVEQLWNELGEKHRFSLLCAYPTGKASKMKDEKAFSRICAQHSHTVPSVEKWTDGLLAGVPNADSRTI